MMNYQKKMRSELRRKKINARGMSLIEVLISIALVGVAMLGLAQLFTLGVLNNARADHIANAVFLAQEQMDHMRSLTATELSPYETSPSDELLDINNDGIYDYRRISKLEPAGLYWRARVLVFSSHFDEVTADAMLADPQAYDSKANIQTLISR